MNAIGCAEAAEWMQRMVDGDLNREEERLLLRHLDGCDACRKLFERLLLLDEQLQRLPKVDPPVSLVDAILPMLDKAGAIPSSPSSPAAARDVRRRAPTSGGAALKRWFGLLPYGLAGVAAAVVVFVAFGLFESGSGPTGPTTAGTDAGRQEAATEQASGGEAGSFSATGPLASGTSDRTSEPSPPAAKFVAPNWPSPNPKAAEPGEPTASPERTARPSVSAGKEATLPPNGDVIVVTPRATDGPPDRHEPTPNEGRIATLGEPGSVSATSSQPTALSETTPDAIARGQEPTPKPSPAVSSGETTGVAGAGPVVTPSREGWRSPDGRWTAAVENGRIVVRRSETGEAVFRSRLAWGAEATVQGRWSDADTFAYSVTAGGQTFRYMVDLKTFTEISAD